MSENPAAPKRNLHHTMTYRDEEDWLEDMFGKGPYDPDQPFNKRSFAPEEPDNE